MFFLDKSKNCRTVEFNTMCGANTKLIEISAEASISVESSNIDRNIRDLFSLKF